MAIRPEPHYKMVDAARLTAAGGTRTLRKWLAELGYTFPEGKHGRKVTVPESVVNLVNEKFSVRPLK